MHNLFKYVFAILCFGILSTFLSCSEEYPIVIKSSEHRTKEDRLDVLDEYVNFLTEVEDAKFNIIIYDNSAGRIPGPSDYNYNLLLSLKADSIAKWLVDLERMSLDSNKIDLGQLYEEEPFWELTSEPEYYSNASQLKEVWVFREESVILVNYSSL